VRFFTLGFMIVAQALTKRYGSTTAVDGLSFTVEPGSVTGFLGPNGAGKSTTMRMIVALDRPTSGTVTVAGRPYRDHAAPLRIVGALLDSRAAQSGRSARNHLLALAQTHGIPVGRVDDVLELVGLAAAADRRVGGFSLGMSQRLGIGAALLGDPAVLVLDEPVNGLDPDGVLWVRKLLRGLAGEGRTVLVASHLMSEMAMTADRLVIIGRGRLVAEVEVQELIARSSHASVVVRTPQAVQLRDLLVRRGATVAADGERLGVEGLPAEEVGSLAAEHGLILHELTPQRVSLEQAYMGLTREVVEFDLDATDERDERIAS
jgi:ABC-2 type transport system ATP-binding protein